MTLEQSLEHFAQLTPDKAAVISLGQPMTYAKLWECIQQKAEH